MATEPLRLAREINLRIPALLTTALSHASAELISSQAGTATEDFRATLAEMPPEAGEGAVTFALARFAEQIVQQLSESAGLDPHVVIQHFALTYNASISDE